MKKVKAMMFVTTLIFALLFASTVLAQDTTITILHTNDIHGRFISTNTTIGIDTIAAIYAEIENAILVDAGDTFHGLPFVTLNQGLSAVELMNLSGYSFFTPGNHDFNYGLDRLLELEDMAEFGFLSANIYRGGELLFNDIAVVEIEGVTVGFFGLATPNTTHLTNPANVIDLTFGDPIDAAKRSVAILQDKGVDIIVALGHLGSGARNAHTIDGWAIDVALAVPEIDVIIDGHSHSVHETGELVNGVLIVQAGVVF